MEKSAEHKSKPFLKQYEKWKWISKKWKEKQN